MYLFVIYLLINLLIYSFIHLFIYLFIYLLTMFNVNNSSFKLLKQKINIANLHWLNSAVKAVGQYSIKHSIRAFLKKKQ